MSRPMSEQDRVATVRARLLGIVAGYGGRVIEHSPPMEAMVAELADEADKLARQGLLPARPARGLYALPDTRCPRCGGSEHGYPCPEVP